MLSQKIEKAFNEQIKHELDSGYLYLQMSAYFNAGGFPGMASWMAIQHKEELAHAEKFMGHIMLRGGYALVPAITEPAHKWNSPLEVFRAAYEHERFITGNIHALVKMAHDEGDYASLEFLQWFVKEQVEEEDNTARIVQLLEKVGESKGGVVFADKELGHRKA